MLPWCRNRHFRLLWSCKGGKRAVLLPSGRFATGPGGAGGLKGVKFRV